LPLDPRFLGLNQAEGDGLLRAIKIYSPPSFRGEVKLSAPCHNILQHVNEPVEVRKRYFTRQNSLFPLPVPTALLLGNSAGRIIRELWWTN
jgi:hypothetical protein